MEKMIMAMSSMKEFLLYLAEIGQLKVNHWEEKPRFTHGIQISARRLVKPEEEELTEEEKLQRALSFPDGVKVFTSLKGVETTIDVPELQRHEKWPAEIEKEFSSLRRKAKEEGWYYIPNSDVPSWSVLVRSGSGIHRGESGEYYLLIGGKVVAKGDRLITDHCLVSGPNVFFLGQNGSWEKEKILKIEARDDIALVRTDQSDLVVGRPKGVVVYFKNTVELLPDNTLKGVKVGESKLVLLEQDEIEVKIDPTYDLEYYPRGIGFKQDGVLLYALDLREGNPTIGRVVGVEQPAKLFGQYFNWQEFIVEDSKILYTRGKTLEDLFDLAVDNGMEQYGESIAKQLEEKQSLEALSKEGEARLIKELLAEEELLSIRHCNERGWVKEIPYEINLDNLNTIQVVYRAPSKVNKRSEEIGLLLPEKAKKALKGSSLEIPIPKEYIGRAIGSKGWNVKRLIDNLNRLGVPVGRIDFIPLE